MSADAGGGRMHDSTPPTPFLVAASLSGESDAAWARGLAPHVDVAILGGIALDAKSRGAAEELVARDRNEFLPDSPIRFIDEQLSAVAGGRDERGEDTTPRPGFNLRSATPAPIREAAAVCAAHGAICEVNAHCRQPELRAAGCGESLLRDDERLHEHVKAATDTGATTSVKVRAEVSGVDLVAVARTIARAGADWIHVDAMDSEATIAELREAIDGEDLGLTLVANNGVRDRRTVTEYAAYGADAVSIARPTRSAGVGRPFRPADPEAIRAVADAIADWRTGRLPGEADAPRGTR
ncbi:tRNA-dihydrouridine synthase [Halorubrum vacuolatum]|uniref:TIM-barrel protein, putative n=1 Tax=Halorubrum vacuolatum TaxID=63740 RepID=A0A238WVZ6_HALVU|nr:tRNA-dihydrouridine synthase [Halorubrum vacuolatum]SNR50603.1 TIM-barrel protein, putative [Halorubrum vacuolatum]